jgi:hypothetical protein
MNNTTYIIVVLFIILGCLTPVQNYLAGLLGFSSTNIVFNLGYAIVLVGIFILIKYLIDKKKKDDKENFFFEVSNPQKCSGGFFGKPATFQYTQVGSGDCKPQNYPPLGMIDNVHSCLYGNASLYPQGVSYEHPGRVPALPKDTIDYNKIKFDSGLNIQQPLPESITYPYADVGNRL